MKFIIITGPQAVGKMTVGMEIVKKTGMRLFHNHMSIELAIDVHGEFNKDAKILSSKIRNEIFDSIVSNDKHPGLIFTYVWAFDLESEYDYINKLIKKYEDKNWETYIVELESDLETRIERNTTPLRLEQKASKRNTDWSHNELLSTMDKYRLNSNNGEITHKNYIRINNTDLSAENVADKIVKEFNL